MFTNDIMIWIVSFFVAFGIATIALLTIIGIVAVIREFTEDDKKLNAA